MMAAQMDAGQKRGLSDYVIDNDGDFAALERAAALVWDSLLARA
jgi:dephospho-CoA kinase